jgi:hypothetical protein
MMLLRIQKKKEISIVKEMIFRRFIDGSLFCEWNKNGCLQLQGLAGCMRALGKELN